MPFIKYAPAGGGGAGLGGVGALDTTYDPVGLWQFDGLANAGTAGTGAGTAIETTWGTIHQNLDVCGNGNVASYIDTTWGCLHGTTAAAALRITGDMTFQLVYTPFVEDIDSFGSIMFAIGGTGSAQANNESVMLQLGNFADKLRPSFRWEHGTSTRVTVTDTAFDMTPAVPHHITCRRFDVGGGSYTGQLYVDGVLIKELTGQTGPDGGTSARIQFGRNGNGDVGMQPCLYHCAKLVDRKLTDGELAAELALTGLAV